MTKEGESVSRVGECVLRVRERETVSQFTTTTRDKRKKQERNKNSSN
jgi:hypothetical protein